MTYITGIITIAYHISYFPYSNGIKYSQRLHTFNNAVTYQHTLNEHA